MKNFTYILLNLKNIIIYFSLKSIKKNHAFNAIWKNVDNFTFINSNKIYKQIYKKDLINKNRTIKITLIYIYNKVSYLFKKNIF